ncbi:MAG: hypothetical protein ACLUUO_18560 [Sellimonas intestinalis]
MSEKIKRCAIYIRVSTSEQLVHGKSLEAQKVIISLLVRRIVGLILSESMQMKVRQPGKS